MKTVIHKWFWAWDVDKEEAWLNDMAARGCALSSYSFCRYEFEPCAPGEYGVRIELLEQRPTTPASQQYIRFVEETGAEQVASYMNWVYFRKKRSDGPFDLFSDLESRIKHLQRIIRLMLSLLVVNLCPALYNLYLYCQFGHPISLVFVLGLAVTVVLGCGLWKLYQKMNRMKQDRQIVETPLTQREGASVAEAATPADIFPEAGSRADGSAAAQEQVNTAHTVYILLFIASCGLAVAAIIFLGIAIFGKDDVAKGMLIPGLLCETLAWLLNLVRGQFMKKKGMKP